MSHGAVNRSEGGSKSGAFAKNGTDLSRDCRPADEFLLHPTPLQLDTRPATYETSRHQTCLRGKTTQNHAAATRPPSLSIIRCCDGPVLWVAELVRSNHARHHEPFRPRNLHIILPAERRHNGRTASLVPSGRTKATTGRSDRPAQLAEKIFHRRGSPRGTASSIASGGAFRHR